MSTLTDIIRSIPDQLELFVPDDQSTRQGYRVRGVESHFRSSALGFKGAVQSPEHGLRSCGLLLPVCAVVIFDCSSRADLIAVVMLCESECLILAHSPSSSCCESECLILAHSPSSSCCESECLILAHSPSRQADFDKGSIQRSIDEKMPNRRQPCEHRIRTM
ncbi:hypothetical protein RRG08_057699 [Elysia crispata]|uniref:Uncharacterized protein n=1 Tax=Elysia crispata TaxID=231223 RepID=A0AAE1AET5_9GAST|nr:hypothetical protein RRG08_057699 [Elysia crispata]